MDDRWVHEPDLPSLISRFLSPAGFLDPDFAQHVAAASPYFSDLFGLQALADISREEMLADFVPTRARLTAEDAHSLTLEFSDGFTATFYPQSTVRVLDQEVAFSHAAFDGEDWRAVRDNIDTFLRVLDEGRGTVLDVLDSEPCVR